jgi:HK97 family phage portal protein
LKLTSLNLRAAAPSGPLASLISPNNQSEPPKRATHEFLKAYSELPWLRAVTERIATDFASVRWSLMVPSKGKEKIADTLQRCGPMERDHRIATELRAGNLKEVAKHPLLTLLHNGNPQLVGADMLKVTQLHKDITGDAFWILERNAAGMPVEAWPTPPHLVSKIPTKTEPFFMVKMGGIDKPIRAEDMVWFKNVDPFSPYGRGSGTAGAVADELETDELIAKHDKMLFFNRARPDLLITMEEATPEQIKAAEVKWYQKLRGVFRAGVPIFMRGQGMKVQDLSQSVADLQIPQLRAYHRDIIHQTFGVPPEMLGIVANSNRATIGGAQMIYAVNVLRPRLEAIRTVLQFRLVPEFDDRLILAYESPVPKDREFELSVFKTAPWALEADEWREMGNRDRWNDDNGQTKMVPFSMIPKKGYFDMSTGLDAGKPGSSGDAPPEPGAGSPGGKPVPKAFTASRARTVSPMEAVAMQGQADLSQIFREAVAAMQGRIDEDAVRHALIAEVAASLATSLPIIDLRDGLQPTEAVLLLLLLRGAGVEMESMRQVFGEDTPDFDAANPAVRSAVRRQMDEFITQLIDSSRAAVNEMLPLNQDDRIPKDVLARLIIGATGLNQPQAAVLVARVLEALAAGIVLAEAEQNLLEFVQRQTRNRADLFATHESFDAAYEGRFQAWSQLQGAGLLSPDLMLEWHTHPELSQTGPCPVCSGMHGQRQKKGRPFVSPKNGATALRPPIHVLCVCDVEIVRV